MPLLCCTCFKSITSAHDLAVICKSFDNICMLLKACPLIQTLTLTLLQKIYFFTYMSLTKMTKCIHGFFYFIVCLKWINWWRYFITVWSFSCNKPVQAIKMRLPVQVNSRRPKHGENWSPIIAIRDQYLSVSLWCSKQICLCVSIWLMSYFLKLAYIYETLKNTLVLVTYSLHSFCCTQCTCNFSVLLTMLVLLYWDFF